MSSPLGTTPVRTPIEISQQQLARTNAIRASQNLPPLEQSVPVRVTSPSEPPLTIREKLENLQGSLPKPQQDNEAVSLLRIPYSGSKTYNQALSNIGIENKAGTKVSSQNIPSTSIADVATIIPVGFGVGLAAKGVASYAKVGSKTVAKVGSADIGLFVKESPAFSSAKRFESQTRTLPKPDTVKVNSPFKSENVGLGNSKMGMEIRSEPPLTKINLGTGIGKMVSRDTTKGGISTSSKPPPTKPSFDPFKSSSEKQVGAGKGLVQLIREKPITRQIPKTIKPKFEMNQALKQENFLRNLTNKPKPKPLVQKSSFKEYPIFLGKSKPQIIRTKVLPITIQKQTQAQKQTQKYLDTLQVNKFKMKHKTEQNFMPIFKTRQTFKQSQPQKQPQPQIIIPRQAQPQRNKTPVPIVPTIPIFPTNPPQRQPPIKPPRPPDKKRPPLFPPLGSNSNTFTDSILGKSGNRKGYTGNVPEFQFTGMYNRQETIYGKVKNPKTTGKSLSSKFSKLI